MKLYLKFDPKTALKKIIQEQLDKLQIQYEYMGFAEIEIEENISGEGLR